MSVESSIYDLSLISSKHNQTKQTHIHENIEVEKDAKFRESNPCKSKSVFSHPKIMIKKKKVQKCNWNTHKTSLL